MGDYLQYRKQRMQIIGFVIRKLSIPFEGAPQGRARNSGLSGHVNHGQWRLSGTAWGMSQRTELCMENRLQELEKGNGRWGGGG